MVHTDLIRSERVRAQLATGYVLRSRGLRPVADRDVLAVGGGAAYSTTADMARYVAALLNPGADSHGSLLKPATLASMFDHISSWTPGFRALDWGSFWATRTGIAPSAMTVSCPVSCRR